MELLKAISENQNINDRAKIVLTKVNEYNY